MNLAIEAMLEQLATHDGAIELDGVRMPCSVLGDEERVLHLDGVCAFLLLTEESRQKDDLAKFAGDENVLPFFPEELKSQSIIKLQSRSGEWVEGIRTGAMVAIMWGYMVAMWCGHLREDQLSVGERSARVIFDVRM